jgi:hypothetical protein
MKVKSEILSVFFKHLPDKGREKMKIYIVSQY